MDFLFSPLTFERKINNLVDFWHLECKFNVSQVQFPRKWTEQRSHLLPSYSLFSSGMSSWKKGDYLGQCVVCRRSRQSFHKSLNAEVLSFGLSHGFTGNLPSFFGCSDSNIIICEVNWLRKAVWDWSRVKWNIQPRVVFAYFPEIPQNDSTGYLWKTFILTCQCL